jgi:hypothetical protein
LFEQILRHKTLRCLKFFGVLRFSRITSPRLKVYPSLDADT